MNKIFETIVFNRKVLVEILEKLSREKLVKIPNNFNNSIIWNVGHILVTEQLLCYKNAGIPFVLKEDFIAKFCKGSRATEEITDIEINFIKNNLVSSILKTQKDYNNKLFNDYDSYLTSAGIELKNIEDALKFNVFHEGIHLGIILSIKKML